MTRSKSGGRRKEDTFRASPSGPLDLQVGDREGAPQTSRRLTSRMLSCWEVSSYLTFHGGPLGLSDPTRLSDLQVILLLTRSSLTSNWLLQQVEVSSFPLVWFCTDFLPFLPSVIYLHINSIKMLSSLFSASLSSCRCQATENSLPVSAQTGKKQDSVCRNYQCCWNASHVASQAPVGESLNLEIK